MNPFVFNNLSSLFTGKNPFVFNNLSSLFTGKNTDIPSPSDIVPKSSIAIINAKINIEFNKLNIPFTAPPMIALSNLLDTNSMDPVLDFGHHALMIEGSDAANKKILRDYLKAGDICVYAASGKHIIHRITKIEQDSHGRRFRFKGDHNLFSDNYLVRDENILWLVAGIIY